MSEVKKLADVLVDGSKYMVSLRKLLPEGVSVVDLEGHVSNEFGEPVFQLCVLKLSNGENIWLEGEHDLPYLTGIDCLPEGQLQALSEEER